MKSIPTTTLLQAFVFLLMVALWICFIISSYRRNLAAPWGFGILILESAISGFGIPIFKNHFVVFFLDVVFVICLFAMLLNINGIQNQIFTTNPASVLRSTGIGIIAGLVLAVIFITAQVSKYFEHPPLYTLMAFLSIGAQAAITEELLFRGFFLRDLIRYGFNAVFAVLFQAMVFAVLHLSVYPDNLTAIFIVFLNGLIAGFLTLKSNSLISAFTLHIVFNLLTVIWWVTIR